MLRFEDKMGNFFQRGATLNPVNLGALTDYLNGGFKNIQGWCIPHLWNVIKPIHEFQERLSIQKPIAEIGVFHGKFFIGLALTKQGYGEHHAFDVFDMQQFNLDGAGEGNLKIFKENCEKSGVLNDEIAIIRADSMAISRAQISDILAKTGGFSLFSVDGCHLVEHTINDFLIASELTCPEGVIFVDDYTNADWPGVSEGMAKLYYMNNPKFVPLVVTCNKMITCHISHHNNLIKIIGDFLKSSYAGSRLKFVKRFGYDCINYHPDYHSALYI